MTRAFRTLFVLASLGAGLTSARAAPPFVIVATTDLPINADGSVHFNATGGTVTPPYLNAKGEVAFTYGLRPRPDDGTSVFAIRDGELVYVAGPTIRDDEGTQILAKPLHETPDVLFLDLLDSSEIVHVEEDRAEYRVMFLPTSAGADVSQIGFLRDAERIEGMQVNARHEVLVRIERSDEDGPYSLLRIFGPGDRFDGITDSRGGRHIALASRLAEDVTALGPHHLAENGEVVFLNNYQKDDGIGSFTTETGLWLSANFGSDAAAPTRLAGSVPEILAMPGDFFEVAQVVEFLNDGSVYFLAGQWATHPAGGDRLIGYRGLYRRRAGTIERLLEEGDMIGDYEHFTVSSFSTNDGSTLAVIAQLVDASGATINALLVKTGTGPWQTVVTQGDGTPVGAVVGVAQAAVGPGGDVVFKTTFETNAGFETVLYRYENGELDELIRTGAKLLDTAGVEHEVRSLALNTEDPNRSLGAGKSICIGLSVDQNREPAIACAGLTSRPRLEVSFKHEPPRFPIVDRKYKFDPKDELDIVVSLFGAEDLTDANLVTRVNGSIVTTADGIGRTSRNDVLSPPPSVGRASQVEFDFRVPPDAYRDGRITFEASATGTTTGGPVVTSTRPRFSIPVHVSDLRVEVESSEPGNFTVLVRNVGPDIAEVVSLWTSTPDLNFGHTEERVGRLRPGESRVVLVADPPDVELGTVLAGDVLFYAHDTDPRWRDPNHLDNVINATRQNAQRLKSGCGGCTTTGRHRPPSPAAALILLAAVALRRRPPVRCSNEGPKRR